MDSPRRRDEPGIRYSVNPAPLNLSLNTGSQGDLSHTLFVRLERLMQRKCLRTLTVALLMNLWMSLAAHGQSLGEIAREYREKQDAEQASGVKPKVFTNKDMPENPEGYQAPREPEPDNRASASNGFDGRNGRSDGRAFSRPPEGSNNPFAEPGYRTSPQGGRPSPQRGPQGMQAQGGGEQWTQQIQERENRIASMQARIDQMNASMRSGGMSAQGPYNRSQSRQAERVAEMQTRLDEQKRKLDQMQDAARHAGMHTQVYDP
jgi:hypothetical protein